MERIVVDESLVSRLKGLDYAAELCDPSGKVLARVHPVFDPLRYEGLEPQITEEELNRREQETEEYTTAEVLAHLTLVQ